VHDDALGFMTSAPYLTNTLTIVLRADLSEARRAAALKFVTWLQSPNKRTCNNGVCAPNNLRVLAETVCFDPWLTSMFDEESLDFFTNSGLFFGAPVCSATPCDHFYISISCSAFT
jgi:hypothetical protein